MRTLAWGLLVGLWWVSATTAQAQTLTFTISTDALQQTLLPELCKQHNLCLPSDVIGMPAIMDWLVRHFSHGGCDNMGECGITMLESE